MGSFKIGDRVNCPMRGINGTITAIDHHRGWVDFVDGQGWSHTWLSKDLTLISAAPPEDDWSFTYEPPKPKVCTCGGAKAKTTHATYCDSRPDATPPYKQPKERMF